LADVQRFLVVSVKDSNRGRKSAAILLSKQSILGKNRGDT